MNVPHFQQELDYSCLAACVRMVLAFYGNLQSEKNLRVLLKTRMGGTSPANVLLRLPALGFNAEVFEASAPYLHNQIPMGYPCIVYVWTPRLPYWKDEAIHSVIVSAISLQTVEVHDPILATGPIEIELADFMRAWAATGYITLRIIPQ